MYLIFEKYSMKFKNTLIIFKKPFGELHHPMVFLKNPIGK